MGLDLCYFLGATLVFLLPGVGLGLWFGVGPTRLDRCITGCSVGLALAVWLATSLSYFDLRLFYPAWIVIAAISLRGFMPRNTGAPGAGVAVWVMLTLAVVAATRFALALPPTLPEGWDPAFHMILARKIQLTQHAISNWEPFVDAELNYPTGSHTLLVVFAAVSGLPLPIVFKFLIQLLGVLTTAQIYSLARAATGNENTGLFAAIAYGLWAGSGSIEYFSWGGLPNELAMLFLVAMLTIWIERGSLALMALLYGGLILAHHHVMVVSAAIIMAVFFWRRDRQGVRLAAAALCGGAIDALFLVRYAPHVLAIGSTGVFHGGEDLMPLAHFAGGMGWALLAVGAVGIVLFCRRGGRDEGRPDSSLMIASCVLVTLFVGGEYLWPLITRWRGEDPSTAFTPSRFPIDLSYFLAIFAGLAIAAIQVRFRLRTSRLFGIALLLSLTELPLWLNLAGNLPLANAEYARACQWVNGHSSPTAVILDADIWTCYLAWRKAAWPPLPASEPQRDILRVFVTAEGVLAGRIAPPWHDYQILRIGEPNETVQGRVLWRDASGYYVEQLWPRFTDSRASRQRS
ncbi:MAG TPA: hypothetical protein VMD30_12785 [Tepidisphaeraceae bacterium]|nr:hypothetical protein [Tepidisphaeraceae bacterium]